MTPLTPPQYSSACELCRCRESPAGDSSAGRMVWADDRLRVVRVLDAPDFPAYYRVIWQAHVAEFSQLAPADRHHCMAAVAAVETVLRAQLRPVKINLAALGNMVAHLHWHVIARYADDSHFPQPIWGARQREPQPPIAQRLAVALDELDHHVARRLDAEWGTRGLETK